MKKWIFAALKTLRFYCLIQKILEPVSGGIAIQNRMAFQGEYFIDRYGKNQTLRMLPIQKILAVDIPVGMGTDATRVSNYNPWLCLYWLTTGKSVG